MINIDTGKCKVLSIQDIQPSPFNARDQEIEPVTSEKFQELCQSLKSEGLVEPLVVRQIRPGGYELIAGTRRYRALKHVGAKEVAVVVRQMNDNDVRVASLVENIHRQDLNEKEKERTLKDIFLASWDVWAPKGWEDIMPKRMDKRTGKEVTFYLNTTEGRLTLAKQYLIRLANEETREGSAIISHNRTQPSAVNKGGGVQTIFPTEEFKELVRRIGYHPRTQNNIIAGYGSGSNKPYHDYWEEMAPISRQKFEKDQRIKQLEEEKKRKLANIQREALRKAQKVKEKSNKEIVEEVTDKFFKSEEREKRQKKKKQEEREKRRQQEEREEEKEKSRARNKNSKQEQEEEQEQEQKQNEPKPYEEKTEKETNPVRARQDIAGLAVKLFKLLTSQDLDIGNLKIGEMQAKSLAATENMKEIASFYATEQTRAWQQYIIVPLSIVIDKYRDILSDAVEEAHRHDDMMRP